MKIPNFLDRNIGLISKKDQLKLLKSHVLICGTGGMGGVCAEILVRMGIGELTIVDHDIFEETNLNRQIHSNSTTIGKPKVKVLKKELLKINKNLKVNAIFDKVNLKNIDSLLTNIDVVVNGMDQMENSLILERTARKKKITIVDAWITPFASVFVMDNKARHWEDFLDLPSKKIEIKNFNEDLMKRNLEKEMKYTFSHFDPFSHVSKKTVKKVLNNKMKRPSFIIVVWLSGIFMANEVFKILTKRKHVGEKGIFYNQYDHCIISGK